MKQVVVFILISLVVLTSCNYEPGVSEAFLKYKFKDGVTSITVPGWLINIATSVADLNHEERELLESIDKVKVLAVEDNNLNARINLHEEFYTHINNKGGYEQLLVVRNEDEHVTIFGKIDENVIREMVILVGGNDNALVYLKGEIKPELINNIAGLKSHEKLVGLNFAP